MRRSFLHLTGVELIENRVRSSNDFFNKCLSERLNVSDFIIPSDGMTELKLSVLPQLMSIHKTAKMVGDYNRAKPVLVTEKLAGNVTACMGFVLEDKYYMPNTALKSDVRDLVGQYKRVIATFRKPIKSENYTELCYVAKGIDLSIIKDLPKVITYRQDDIAVTVEQVTSPQYNPADAPTSEKPSIRAQLQAYQKEQRDKAPAVAPTKNRKDLER